MSATLQCAGRNRSSNRSALDNYKSKCTYLSLDFDGDCNGDGDNGDGEEGEDADEDGDDDVHRQSM